MSLTTATRGNPETWEASYKPRMPYAGSRFDTDAAAFYPYVNGAEYRRYLDGDTRGIFRTSKEKALHGYRDESGAWHDPAVYVETGFRTMVDRLVFDVDVPDVSRHILSARFDNPEFTVPEPSLLTINKLSTHGQATFLLKTPVLMTDAARPKPIGLLAKVERGLTEALGADPAYTGMIHRNPLHPAHDAIYGPAEGYELKDLASMLGPLMGLRREKIRSTYSAIGRNATLFNEARYWAYKHRMEYRTFAEWSAAILDRAYLINAEFPEALPTREVLSTAGSVAKWTWKNLSHFSEEGLRAWHVAGGKKAGAVTSEAKTAAAKARGDKLRKNSTEQIMGALKR